MWRDFEKETPEKEPRLRAAVVSAMSFLATMTSSKITSRFERIRRLSIGWHEYPAQHLEA